MFDIGFPELVLIAVVALLVIGPERLPRVARTVGLWLGRARSAFNSVKSDIDRELRAEELKTMLTKQAEAPELKQFRDELTRDIDSPSPPDTATTPQAVEKKPDATPPASDDERS